MNIKKSIVLRVRLAYLALVVFALAVVARVIIIQYVEGEKWQKLSLENNFQYRTVKATRGNIYSDNGSLLATSLPFYRVIIDPTIAKDDVYRKGIDSLCNFLSAHFKDNSKDYYKRKIQDARKQNKHYVIINRSMINYQTKKMMASWPIVREGRLKGGVIFEKKDVRFYPFQFLAKRTVGFINEDNRGAGLEFSFNQYLAGKNGEALFRKMAGGNWKPIYDDEEEVLVEDGLDIQTTLDINLQDVAEASLLRHLESHDADYGCVVLMEVATGKIKALANLGKIGEGRYAENYNYAVGNQGRTEPGSTFKLASMMALFEMTNVRPTDSIETGKGKFEFYDKVMTDHNPVGYGKISVQQAFEKSSNIAVSKLINQNFGANPQKYVDFIKGLGLADPVGFQMDGEAKPYIKDPSDNSWSGITLPWMSIGYELQMSPLQMLTFYNSVANNGKMIRPIIVSEVKLADLTIEKYDTKVLNEKVCSNETLNMLRKMLEGVVEHGTAANINNATYKIAGKTGTAQKIKDGKYTQTYTTSFCGYFPADRPKYSCIVVIDNPKGFQRYGADVAAPVFKEVADKIYAQDLDLHSPFVPSALGPQDMPVIKAGLYEDLRYICNELAVANHANGEADDWVSTSLNNKSIDWNNRKMVSGLMPDVTGMMLRDALYILENRGLRVRYSGAGRIVNQSMSPGTTIIRGSIIEIILN